MFSSFLLHHYTIKHLCCQHIFSNYFNISFSFIAFSFISCQDDSIVMKSSQSLLFGKLIGNVVGFNSILLKKESFMYSLLLSFKINSSIVLQKWYISRCISSLLWNIAMCSIFLTPIFSLLILSLPFHVIQILYHD